MKNKILTAGLFVFLCSCASQQKAAVVENKETAAAVVSKDLKKEEKVSEVEKKNLAKKSPVAASVGSMISCSSGSDKRTLESKATESGGCELHYGKMGNLEIVATQISGSDKCSEVHERIQGRLEGAGFQCAK